MNSIYDAIDMSRVLLIFNVILALAASTSAQPVDTLTVEEAVDRALTENLELRQAEYETARQEAALGQERLSLLPRVTASSSVNRSYGLRFDETAGRLTPTGDVTGGR